MVIISEVEKSVSESVSKLKENADSVSGNQVRGPVVEELTQLKTQIQEIRDRQHKLLEKNRELRDAVTASGTGDPEEEVHKAIERQKNLRDDFMELKDQLNSLKLKTDQIPNDYEFEDIVDNFQEKTDQLEEIIPAVENAFETAQRAREESIDGEDLEETRQSLESELVSEEQFDEMSQALSGLKDSVNELNENLARTRLDEAVDVASIKQQLEELRDESDDIDPEEIKDRIRKLEVSSDILESHLEEEVLETQEQLETNIYSLASAKADNEDVRQLGQKIGEIKNQAGKKISDLESSLNALDMRIKSLAVDEKVDTSELEEEIEKARDEITITLLDTLRGLEEETASSSDVRRAHTKIEELESLAESLNSDVEEISERLEQAEIEEAIDRSELESSIEDLRKQTASTNELRGVHESLEILKDRTDDIRSDLTGIEIDEKVDREELEEEIQKARDEVTISIMDTVHQLRQELATKNELRGVHETLGLFNDRHKKMKQYLDQTSNSLEELDESTTERFGSVDERFGKIDSRIEKLDEEVRTDLGSDIGDLRQDMEERVSEAESDLAGEIDSLSSDIRENAGEIDTRINELGNDFESRIDDVDDRLDSRIENVDKELGSRIDEVDEKLERQEIEEKVDRSELEEAVEDLRDEMSGVDADQVADLERRMEDMSSLMLEMVRKFSAE